MNIELKDVPKWFFAFLGAIVSSVLFYAIIYPAHPINLGTLGLIGRTQVALSPATFRIGPKGVERPGFDPGFFETTSGGVDGFVDVQESKGSFCVINDIIQTSSGACLLHYDGEWKIKATGGVKCRATCFSVNLSVR